MPQPEPAAAPGSGSIGAIGSLLSELAAGIEYARRRRGLLALMAMAAVINLALVPAFSLLPILVQEHLRGEALTLGGTTSAFGLGTLGGGILLSVWGGTERRIMTSLLAIVVIGVVTFAIGIAPASMLWAATAGLALLGMLQPLANGPIGAVMQAVVAPAYQGRVFTLLTSIATAMAPLGLAVAGPVADAVGVRAWFLAGGAVCAVMALLAFLVPAIVHIEDAPDQP